MNLARLLEVSVFLIPLALDNIAFSMVLFLFPLPKQHIPSLCGFLRKTGLWCCFVFFIRTSSNTISLGSMVSSDDCSHAAGTPSSSWADHQPLGVSCKDDSIARKTSLLKLEKNLYHIIKTVASNFKWISSECHFTDFCLKYSLSKILSKLSWLGDIFYWEPYSTNTDSRLLIEPYEAVPSSPLRLVGNYFVQRCHSRGSLFAVSSNSIGCSLELL